MAAILNHAVRRYLSTSGVRAAGKGSIEGYSATTGSHKDGTWKMWRNLTYFVAFPAIIVSMVSCYIDHQKHHGHRPEFVKYDYLRVRTKRFPWGDGNHTLFHNPNFNALPDGYEDEQ